MNHENDKIILGHDHEENSVTLKIAGSGAVFDLSVEAARRMATGLLDQANCIERLRKRRGHLRLVRQGGSG